MVNAVVKNTWFTKVISLLFATLNPIKLATLPINSGPQSIRHPPSKVHRHAQLRLLRLQLRTKTLLGNQVLNESFTVMN